jgi:branched-chain amino acid transport system permease protein
MRLVAAGGTIAFLTLLFALPELVPVYFVVLATRIIIFAIFAMSLDLLMGYTGLPSFGHAAYFGMGSYTAALIAINSGTDFFGLLAAAALASALLAAFFGVLVLRSAAHRIYFMMLTLALSQVVWALAFQWRSVTHGDDGIAGIGKPFIGKWHLSDPGGFYWAAAAVGVVCGGILLLIANSPFGLTLKGIRESSSRMSALGYNVWLHQYLAFVLAGTFAGIAGAMLALQNGIASPGQLSVAASAEAMLMVILGGAGTMIGPALGAFIVVLLGFLVSEQTERWISILGIIYIIVVLAAPRGIYPMLRSTAQRLVRRPPARMQPSCLER